MSEEIQLGRPLSAPNLSFIERIAERLRASASSKTVFGEPVEREGVTVIPVAKVRYGFGGGAGVEKDKEGSGGGGGVNATPAGYIEIKNGAAQFRPIRDPAATGLILLAGGVAALLILHRLKK